MMLGELVQFTTYVYMLYGPVQWLVNLPRVLAQAGVSAGKVFEVLEEHDDLKDAVKPVDLDIDGDIEFDHVSFGYKAYNPVLKDVSFSIKKGEMIGVVGHSGAGKSTLINLVMRLYDPTSGSVRIDGHDLREISQFRCVHRSAWCCRRRSFLTARCLTTSAMLSPKRPLKTW